MFWKWWKSGKGKDAPEPSAEDTRIRYAAAYLHEIGRRERQEDALLIVDDAPERGRLYAVCDGMGGMSDGAAVSNCTVDALRQQFEAWDAYGDIPSQLRDTLRNVSDEVYAIYGGASGTTAVVVHIHDDCLHYASVGDSAAYLLRGDLLIKLNCDHAYVNDLYRETLYAEDIIKEVAYVLESGSLTEYVGKAYIGDVDGTLRPMRLYDGDVLLLCSDGVSGAMDEDALIAALRHDPKEACRAMQEYIENRAHTSQDNYTAIVVSCGYSGES